MRDAPATSSQIPTRPPAVRKVSAAQARTTIRTSKVTMPNTIPCQRGTPTVSSTVVGATPCPADASAWPRCTGYSVIVHSTVSHSQFERLLRHAGFAPVHGQRVDDHDIKRDEEY